MKAILLPLRVTAAFSASACNQQQASGPEKQQQTQAATETPAVEPEALAALTRMGQYLRSLETFELEATTSIDEVTDAGQKLQFDGATTYRVRRPNAMFVETRTDRKHRQFIYDGATFTVFAPRQGFYAQVPTNGTNAELITHARERYDIELPLVDLFFWGTDQADMSAITSASHIGFARINGVDTDQYAFRQEGLDWQVWIERGDRPLPRKIVITTLDGEANPQYTATLNWNANPGFSNATFTFRPPAEARLIRINSAPTEAPAAN